MIGFVTSALYASYEQVYYHYTFIISSRFSFFFGDGSRSDLTHLRGVLCLISA